jgi:N-acylglucosamine 2-epimerase
MIRLESTQELARAADAFGDAAFAERLRRTARETAREIMDRFVQPDGLVLEALSGDYAPVDTLFGRFINPGHTLEDMWFVIHHASRENDPRTARRAAGVARAVCRVGWDAQYGGFPQFLDRSGRPPEGRVEPGLESHPMMVKLRALWDKKLWWTHSEALYALLLSYEVTREEWALEEYGRVHEYAFRTFPNPDRATGEWIQIRDRQGRPEDTVVALPVKDPMHILRAFLHTLGVLGRLESDGR